MMKVARQMGITRVMAALMLAGSMPSFVWAGESHYVNGVEGIKGATLPPSGLYGRIYGVYYHADQMKDNAGDTLPIDFDVQVYALVPRLIWVTPFQILGADYFADISVPVIRTDLSIGAAKIDAEKTGMGDICVEPLGLAWHGTRYDAALAVGVYLPVGEYDKDDPASPGKDMWTSMGTAGVTLYADDAKTWSASILSRYEIHSQKQDLHYTPGDDFHFEWGLAKTVNKTLDVGLTGYCYWQVTSDSGTIAGAGKSRVHAAGPEVNLFMPSILTFLSGRVQWEFGAENNTEGMLGAITLTKIF
jgi:hypothetical protein